MVVKAQIPTCVLHGQEKKKKFPYSLDLEVTGLDLWCQFWK